MLGSRGMIEYDKSWLVGNEKFLFKEYVIKIF